jgi:hypothetical protein
MPRTAILLSAVMLASGCLFATKSSTHVTNYNVEESTNVGSAIGLEITTRVAVDPSSVVVTLLRVRSCTRLRTAVYDERQIKVVDETAFGPANPLLLVLAPLVMGVSAIVAEGAVAADDGSTAHKTRTIGAVRTTCSTVDANVAVELTLPSGSVLSGTTDVAGHAVFAISETEPDDGTVTARVTDQARSTAFFKTTTACEREREEIYSHAIAEPTVEQRVQSLHAVPAACGDAREHAWSLTATAALEAVALRCESIAGLAREVASIDPALYMTMFVTEPDIAHCIDGQALARQADVPCIERRRMEMLSAEQLDAVQERTRILTSLTDCDPPPPVAPPPIEELTKNAYAAARGGDCITAKTIAAELRAREGGRIRDGVFLDDPAVQHCFLTPDSASVRTPAPKR